MKNWHKAIIAAFFVAVGAIIILSLAAEFNKPHCIIGILIIAVGLIGMSKQNSVPGNVFSIIVAALGVGVLMSILIEFSFNILYFWAGAFVFLGICIIFNILKEKKTDNIQSIVFGTRKTFVDKMESETLNVTCGSVELNYCKAEVKEDITLNVGVMFGKMVIKVPSDVNIMYKNSSYLSSFITPKIVEPNPAYPTITIESVSVFGVITIKRIKHID